MIIHVEENGTWLRTQRAICIARPSTTPQESRGIYEVMSYALLAYIDLTKALRKV
jgi:hypothetical protein